MARNASSYFACGWIEGRRDPAADEHRREEPQRRRRDAAAGDGVEDHAGRTARAEEDGAFEEFGLGLAGAAALAGEGQGELVAFDGHDGAGLDEARDRLAQAAQVFARAAEGLHDGFEAHRLVAGTREELEEDFFGAHALSFVPPSRLPK